jgi:FixJ family two-component response regulator
LETALTVYQQSRLGETCQPHASPSVLVVDDDLGTRETFAWALKASGIQVRTAGCGADAIKFAREMRFDLLLIDLELPDMRGTDVVRMLKSETAAVPFVLISGFLTTDVTVEAMKLGALNVMDKPVSVDVLPRLLAAMPKPCALADADAFGEKYQSPTLLENLTRFADTARPGSAAERWAVLVLKGCGAVNDLNTLEDWAEVAALSYTALRQLCVMVNVRPHDARDFVRVFRAVLRAEIDGSPIESLLNVADSRTLGALLRKSGIVAPSERQRPRVDEFLRNQRLLPSENFSVRLLSDIVSRHTPKTFR